MVLEIVDVIISILKTVTIIAIIAYTFWNRKQFDDVIENVLDVIDDWFDKFL